MNDDTRPLYTTIEKGYLERLCQNSFLLDSILKGSVNRKHLDRVILSLQKARSKHPMFAKRMTVIDLDSCRDELKLSRALNDIDEKEGRQDAVSVLKEEVLEAMEKSLEGDVDGFLSEAADSIAVLFRMMELAEGRKP